MNATMKTCTVKEFQAMADNMWKQVLHNELTAEECKELKAKLFKELYEYEIIPDFEKTNIPFIDDYCTETRETRNNNGMLYTGSLSSINAFDRIGKENGFTYFPVGDNGYRRLRTNKEVFAIATYCEGDLSIAKYNNEADYNQAITECEEFYNEN